MTTRDEAIVALIEDRDEWRARAEDLEHALERIAMPKRPDGTYNLSREACEQIAREAISKRN